MYNQKASATKMNQCIAKENNNKETYINWKPWSTVMQNI